MSKIVLSKLNLEAFTALKKLKNSRASGVADKIGISHSAATHHLGVLKKAGKITRDKKTKLWSVK